MTKHQLVEWILDGTFSSVAFWAGYWWRGHADKKKLIDTPNASGQAR